MSLPRPLPPGPPGGYKKGGRPVKPYRNQGRRGFGGFVVHEDPETREAWVFVRNSRPLRKRVLGEVTGMDDGEIESWALGRMEEAKKSLQASEGKKLSVNERKLEKFIGEMWGSTSRNRS